MKNYENDLHSMMEQQKKQVDRAEEQQHVDLKVTSKKIRAEQEKELKAFRDGLKREMKLLKHEVELLPKERRKEELKLRKELMEKEQSIRVSTTYILYQCYSSPAANVSVVIPFNLLPRTIIS